MAAREAAFPDQMPAVNVAVVGLVVVAYADASWLARAHRRIVERRRVLLARVVDGAGPAAPAASTKVVSGPGLGFYHRPGCGFAAARDWPLLPRDEVAARDAQRPCGVCRP